MARSLPLACSLPTEREHLGAAKEPDTAFRGSCCGQCADPLKPADTGSGEAE
jgi:hypothetical protein